MVATSLQDLTDIVRSLEVTLIVVALDDMSGVALLYPYLKRLRFELLKLRFRLPAPATSGPGYAVRECCQANDAL